MSDDAGLAPPTPPLPKGPSIERGPDLEAGFVNKELAQIVADQDPYVGKLAVAATTQTSGKPSFQPFKAGGDGLAPVKSTLDKTLETDSPELALAKFTGTAVAKPFTSGVDAYQVGKIKEMQQEFYAKHGDTLIQLSKDLSKAKRAMRELGEWLGKQHIPDNDIRGIMNKKAATGNEAMRDLDAAIAQAEDPGDRDRLRAMKENFDKWTKERDERLKPEWKEETELENRIDHINREIHQNQADALVAAGRSDGPVTETGGGKIISSTHQQLQSFTHANSLRDFLLGERLRMAKMMKGVE